MGCCASTKRSEPPGSAGEARRPSRVDARDLPPPEEEKVKEVLSETRTPAAKPRPMSRPRRVDGAAVPSVERGAEKARLKGGGAARVPKDGGRVGRAVGPAHSGEERSEVASESSAATGPERSPSKPPRRRGAAVSGELRRARRDRGPAAVPGAGRPSGRASPSPPPPARRDPSSRRSPSPAAKRPQDQRRDAAAYTQRKPPVPVRPGGRASPRRAQEAPPLPSSTQPPVEPRGPARCASPPSPEKLTQEDTGAGDAAGDGEGKESLDNPSVSMECFIFL